MMSILVGAVARLLRAASSACPSLFGLLRAASASTPSSRSAPAASTCCSARWSRVLDEPGLHFLWPKLGWQRAASCNWLGQVPRARPAPGPGVPAQPAGQLRGGRADGHRRLVRDVRQRPGARSSSRTRTRAARWRANVSNATVRCLSNMKLARHAGDPPRDEPDRARRGLAASRTSGATSSARVYIRKVHFRDARDDPADRGEGRQPAAPGDLAPSSRTAPTR